MSHAEELKKDAKKTALLFIDQQKALDIDELISATFYIFQNNQPEYKKKLK